VFDASVSKSLLATVTRPVLFKVTSNVMSPLEIAFAKSYVAFDEEVPLVNTPPLAATIVGLGKSSAVNPVPLATILTDEN